MLPAWCELGTPAELPSMFVPNVKSGGRVMASSRAASILKVFSSCRAHHKVCLSIPAAVISCRLGIMHTCTVSFHCSVRRSGTDEAGGEGAHPRTRVVDAASYWFVDAAPFCDGNGADVAITAERMGLCHRADCRWTGGLDPLEPCQGSPAGDADETSHCDRSCVEVAISAEGEEAIVPNNS